MPEARGTDAGRAAVQAPALLTEQDDASTAVRVEERSTAPPPAESGDDRCDKPRSSVKRARENGMR